ncbi:MAG: hypothetical protein DRI84_04655 [Bacteroidetes bacterium]|nr:MAG: hypothetical protein DRI84_04655 [Bacteroidota bacterium]
MPYKIAGTKNETSRIIIIDETDYSIEKTVLIEGSGEYEVEVTEGKKTILARLNTGETVGYGGVDAVEVVGVLISDGEVFNSGNTIHTSVTKLTDTKAIVCYSDRDNSDHGTACVLDINGSTITAGDEHVFYSGSTYYISIIRLTDTKAVVCYMGGSHQYGTACVLDVSGSIITSGDVHVFNSGSSPDVSVTALTSTKAIVCYRDTNSDGYGTACVLDINDSTITSGEKHVFNSGNTIHTSVIKLTDTKAIVCYRDGSNNNYGTVCVLDISGSTITTGNEYVFSNGYVSYPSIIGLTDTKAIACYQDGSNNTYGTVCFLDISGSIVTVGDEHIFNSGSTYYISITALTNTEAVVCYKDVGNNDYGTAKLIYNL